ncbi:hypothetical protein PGTUg99_026598 [Puccinia graminis f. sp. tritici]|uniref:Secreted protein n=1 Tax=Puccinia graminis f. sp. tritici TaxID=56615 RepID=A0A5B0REE7_PUCGR|nr:hypothetical protein PGTUg99_026598 [Puccinia graminis f. sp. tritici]
MYFLESVILLAAFLGLAAAFDPRWQYVCNRDRPYGLCGFQQPNGNWYLTPYGPTDPRKPREYTFCPAVSTNAFCADYTMLKRIYVSQIIHQVYSYANF